MKKFLKKAKILFLNKLLNRRKKHLIRVKRKDGYHLVQPHLLEKEL